MKTHTQIMTAICLLAGANVALAQSPGGLPPGLSAGPRGNGPASATVDRVRSQVQERVQERVQQRVQQQTQDRVQSQVQERVQQQVQDRARQQVQTRMQADARRAAEISLRSRQQVAQRVEARDQRVEARDQRLSLPMPLRRGASETAKANAGADGREARIGVGARIGIQAGVAVPPGLTKRDVEIYDEFFGRFNPLRPQSNALAAVAGTDAVGETSPVVGGLPSNRRGRGVEQRPEAVNDRVAANLDFANRVRIAARQRRAEISELRDQAIATGQADLLTRADEMERRLDAFSEEQIQLQSRLGFEVEADSYGSAVLDQPTQ